ncbi:MAG: Uma2 family endonuclease [bacterium]|nr:Uma2 family endonuclease [bacterium]
MRVSVDEYLHTSFDGPDREYVDGRIVERALGEKDHSRLQRELTVFFIAREKTLGTFCFPGQRIQVTPTRFRVPDVCVYIGEEPDEQIFTGPPFLVVEILSKDDRASEVQEKIEDYLAFGVPYIWVIDPRTRRGYVHTIEGSREARGGVLRTGQPAVEARLADLFE